ncbi:high-affinity branched-chain amino acid ABC transporter permease LivM [Afifella marina]|uniref:Amino acid/amide ABC transporter membrane protein 2, HAAT family n=1 Tax=Afifella marina DSM 2698 TaxID=1120955 RepID=A0A1G5P8E6_AFIMA|nr:high-affinity branched-chain amino acid ABC transporter permease LivM [Afifella marina]MBK1625329.1 high-affinity branched-chain amino acid ABC transporter permease LivM [Afifella marina DSM 2698]MBK1628871.1 high-affinity branched-chain amino acid ABC transporter permease LivM [Afifella marina]MBK5916873.1 branched-chain amino acid ABC transporter permease [Afifella marina]RAI17912.1 branched-chain amino acid ABC transporter permease [Afifella marina DSM 2698]SCZ45837.1 amino acid/amide AB
MSNINQAGSADEQQAPGALVEWEQRVAGYAGEPPFVEEPQRLSAIAAALKDAAIAAAIAAALFLFFIGFRTDIAIGGLDLTTRWQAFGTAIVVVFVGRLLFRILLWRPATKAGTRPLLLRAFGSGEGTPLSEHFARHSKSVGVVALVAAVLYPVIILALFPMKDKQFIDLGVLVLTYIMLGWGLNIVVGLAGLLDLGYVAFYAVGAYSFALFAQFFEVGFWFALPIAGILAACWGLILGFPVLRLRGDYLAIVTLAFGEIIRVVLLNWYTFTGGPNGISGIPDPTFFGLEFARGDDNLPGLLGIGYDSAYKQAYFFYIILALAMITNLVTLRLRKLPLGRAWEALREDEIACRSLGINTTNTKLTAFAIGAMFGGFAGAFFATRQGFISPESFTFMESALILAIVVLGGLGSQMGVVIASIVMIGGFELFRDFAEYRMLIFGLLMVIIMVWRPRGLIATREPSAILKERQTISADMVAQGEGH